MPDFILDILTFIRKKLLKKKVKKKNKLQYTLIDLFFILSKNNTKSLPLKSIQKGGRGKIFEIMSDCMFENLIRLSKFFAFLGTMLLCNLDKYFIYECFGEFIVLQASISTAILFIGIFCKSYLLGDLMVTSMSTTYSLF